MENGRKMLNFILLLNVRNFSVLRITWKEVFVNADRSEMMFLVGALFA